MAYTTINKSTDYFNTVLYTGNGSTNAITGVGFQPDWLWVKCRSDANGGQIFDALRTTNSISPNATDAEANRASDGFTSLDSDGFTMNGSGSGGNTNVSSRTYVAWNWLAANSTASNSDGSITSTVSANTTAGFSIVSYTGNATSGATIGHGLGAVPKMIITKNRDQSSGSQDWCVYHVGVGANKGIFLNLTNTPDTNAKYFNNTTPTSSVFTVGDNLGTNGSGDAMIAYCFAEKKGYSKFGSYTGNGGGTDGTFVYTGFKPAWIMVKRTDSSNNWIMFDNKRNTSNVLDKYLYANLSDAEATGDFVDFTSNGFKWRRSGTANAVNGSGGTYIYMAFAKAPLVGSNNVPCTAR